ncbi:transglycosylase domain-containing protein [Corynebacterium choanae]|uniref:Penicillin-binding protein 1A n=1 Tax=Corynebacterium choanae TaxID=1862358 RepID=A0A3G6J7R7_9CORY|nr:transglycosylase domain-containing protein [Corynebacterium choanae]AZA12480.1 Penicillin-binding protein 1A [Corynebacterium choanae]
MTSSTPEEKSPRRRRARNRHRQHSKWRVALGTFAAVMALVLALPIILFTAAYIVTDVPEPEQLVTKQVSTIYAADDRTELARIVPPEGNRETVSLDKIPHSLQVAVMSAEDREFYSNPGFSISGFTRAVLGKLTGNDAAGGGSTITQQYVKIAVVGNEHSIRRKLRELVVSTKMTREWTKDEILQAYLNTIYFGRNSYGVAAAAQAFFNKPLGELTPAESAVLAASIQRPSQLDPWVNREEAEDRWNYVVDGMVKMGEITQAERDAMVYPEVTDPALNAPYVEAEGTNGLIKNQVVKELARLGIDESEVETKGLRIVTTIDPKVQNSVLAAIENNKPTWDDQIRQAVVSIDPRTGAVKGYYGGQDAEGWDFADGPRPTGSTFKIFGLAAGLQQGIPLTQYFSSAPVTTGSITITNSDGESCGVCSIAQALKMSLNTSFVRLGKSLENGPKDVADMAHALGVARSLPSIPQTLTEPGKNEPYEGIILGQYDSRPFDMAIALGTLANAGVWHQPHFVQRITDADGNVVYEHTPSPGQRRVSANVANSVMYAMAPIAAWSNGNVLAGGRPSAAKTGTVQLGDTGANKDAWMIGATPQLATAVWVGTELNTPLTNSWGGLMYGAGMPATIWKQTMDGALEGEPIETFPEIQPLGYSSPKPAYSDGTGNWGYNYNNGYGGTASTAQATPTEEPVAPADPVPAPAPAVPAVPEAPQEIEILPGVNIPNPLAPPPPPAEVPAE